MPLFRYKAVGADGKIAEGDLEARSQTAAIDRLQTMGYVPIRADEISATQADKRSLRRPLFGSRQITQSRVAVLTQELATLLRAKLPLDRALELLIELSPNARVRQVVTQIREQVHDGATLSAAMETQKGVFSRLYLNMVRAGEAGGAVDSVLMRLAEYMERARELRDTVSSALIYPAILLGVAGLSVVVLLIFVVPQFQQMFEDAGQALPFATQVVISLGEALRGYWWLMLGVILAVAYYFRKQFAEPATRYRWDNRLLGVPLLGELIAKLEVARFSRTLGTLMINGVPLLTALGIVKETLTNQVLAQSMGNVAESLKQGHGLAQPLMEAPYFPKLAAHMIRVGEETGHLEEMLIQVADVYDKEVRSSIKRLLALLEPALILTLGLVIAAIIISILVAILSINELAF
ncbi:MAG TPA: type II secretion system F family protein [Gammaproteobacteria bacterium]|nr:type II secretion system F family protein [Gammaproteobacteria bacterium]